MSRAARPKFTLTLAKRDVKSSVTSTTPWTGPGAQTPPPSPFAATHVVNGIYLGAWSDAENEGELRARGITRVVDIAPECVPHPRTAAVETLRLDVEDHSDAPIAAHLEAALEFMRAALVDARSSVLVHCRQGVSRSATVVIAYLMMHGVPPPRAAVLEAMSPLPSPFLPRGCDTSSDGWSNSSSPPDAPPTPETGVALSYQEAFDFVKFRRPWVSPNLGFTLVLRRLDTTLRRGCGAAMVADGSMEDLVLSQ